MAAPIFVADELVTAAKMNSLPKGVLGYAQVTSSQASITTEVDLTGLAVTVDVAASRRIRITGHGLVTSSVANDVAVGKIAESTTELNRWCQVAVDVAGSSQLSDASAVITPSGGSHTYKLLLSRESGSGSVSLIATSTIPAFILVEDIGGA